MTCLDSCAQVVDANDIIVKIYISHFRIGSSHVQIDAGANIIHDYCQWINAKIWRHALKPHFLLAIEHLLAELATNVSDIKERHRHRLGDRAETSLQQLREAYPELKSNQSFLNLQAQVEGTENRLSVERKRYNESVQGLNTYCRKIPGRFYCGLAGVERAEFFEVEEAAKERPDIDFSGGADSES